MLFTCFRLKVPYDPLLALTWYIFFTNNNDVDVALNSHIHILVFIHKISLKITKYDLVILIIELIRNT